MQPSDRLTQWVSVGFVVAAAVAAVYYVTSDGPAERDQPSAESGKQTAPLPEFARACQKTAGSELLETYRRHCTALFASEPCHSALEKGLSTEALQRCRETYCPVLQQETVSTELCELEGGAQPELDDPRWGRFWGSALAYEWKWAGSLPEWTTQWLRRTVTGGPAVNEKLASEARGAQWGEAQSRTMVVVRAMWFWHLTAAQVEDLAQPPGEAGIGDRR